jgi:hypothetical protein
MHISRISKGGNMPCDIHGYQILAFEHRVAGKEVQQMGVSRVPSERKSAVLPCTARLFARSGNTVLCWRIHQPAVALIGLFTRKVRR